MTLRREYPGPMQLTPPELACSPPLWARGGHAQTILGHLWPSRTPELDAIPLGQQRIRLADGDQLAAWHVRGTSDLLILLFHGLGGDAQADYVRRMASHSLAAGHSVLALDHRGCGAGKGLAVGPYHSGRADDLSAAVALGRKLEPGKRQLAIGFSLSGNALLLLLGKHMQPAPDLAIAVNPPIELGGCTRRISSLGNRAYDLRFVARCRRALRERRSAGLIERQYPIGRWSTLREVDELYTAPAGGFANADDYYERCSALPHLRNIDTPTVLLTAADDPFVTARDFREAELSASIHLHVEETGGHMGYLMRERTPLGTNRWLDYALTHYVKQLAGL